MNEAGYYGFMVMGDAMGPLSYHPLRKGETLPPYPPPPILTPPLARPRFRGYSEPINYGMYPSLPCSPPKRS